ERIRGRTPSARVHYRASFVQVWRFVRNPWFRWAREYQSDSVQLVPRPRNLEADSQRSKLFLEERYEKCRIQDCYRDSVLGAGGGQCRRVDRARGRRGGPAAPFFRQAFDVQ